MCQSEFYKERNYGLNGVKLSSIVYYSRFYQWGAGGLIKIGKVANWLGFKTLTLTSIIQCDAIEVGVKKMDCNF